MEHNKCFNSDYFQIAPGLSGGAVGPGMLSPQQAIFMQQQGMGASRGPFSQQGPGGVLQGPLAYLEKTTSNIGKYKVYSTEISASKPIVPNVTTFYGNKILF